MKTKEQKIIEVEKTLKYLEHLPKVETDAFFYTRLSAKLESQSQYQPLQWLFEVPYLKPAFVVLFLALNIASIVHLNNFYKSQNAENLSVSDEFVTEYDLNQSTDSYLVLNDE